MTEPYAHGSKRDYLLSERERTLASGLRKWATAIGAWNVERSFEEAGCTCTPYRDRLKELETQYKAEQDRLLSTLYESDLAKEIRELKGQVADIDRKEHGPLDAQARKAYPFFSVWLIDEVREGKLDILELGDKEVGSRYAAAWLNGWRPRSLRSEQTPSPTGKAEGQSQERPNPSQAYPTPP